MHEVVFIHKKMKMKNKQPFLTVQFIWDAFQSTLFLKVINILIIVLF